MELCDTIFKVPKSLSAQEPNCPRAQVPKSPIAQEPKCPRAQVPKSPSAQEPKCPRAQDTIFLRKSCRVKIVSKNK
jgi:hypothetical protein